MTHNASRLATLGAIVGSIVCLEVFAQRPVLAQPPAPTSAQQQAQPTPAQPPVPNVPACPPGLSDSDRAMAMMLLDRVRTLTDGALSDGSTSKSGKAENKPTGTGGKVGDKAGKVMVTRDVMDEIAANASQLRVMLQDAGKR